MNEKQLQQAFAQYLAQISGAKSQEELEQFVQKLGKDGLQKEYQKFLQLMKQQSTQKAEHGAKLNMIARLNGLKCPEGEKLVYFEKGGKFCKKCQKIAEQQRAMQQPEKDAKGSKVVKAFKKARCGQEGVKLNNTPQFSARNISPYA